MEEGQCNFDQNCKLSLLLNHAFSPLKPCNSYNVSIQVRGSDFFYCRAPRTVRKSFETNEKGMYVISANKCDELLHMIILELNEPRNLEFVNHEDDFWRATLRWDSPSKSERCVDSYRLVHSYLTFL